MDTTVEGQHPPASNLEIVTAAQRAIAENNLWALTRYLHPDIRWAVATANRSAAPWFADFRGLQGVLAFFEELSKMDHRAFEVKRIAGDGDTVMAWIHVVYGTPNGGEVDMDEVQVWQLEEGKVRSVTLFPDTLQVATALAHGPNDT